MQRRFPGEPRAVLGAVVLSEPLVDYAQFHNGSDGDLHQWRRVAYIVQAVGAVRTLEERSFANAAMIDKLDNLHDLAYLSQVRQTPEQLHRRLARRLGYFNVVHAELLPWASPEVATLLAAATAARQQEFGVPAALVQEAEAELRSRLALRRHVLADMITAYQRHLGVALV